LRLHGLWHDVIVWKIEDRYAGLGESRLQTELGEASPLTNVIEWPTVTVGAHRCAPVAARSPGRNRKLRRAYQPVGA
jgi:hypothetical protein